VFDTPATNFGHAVGVDGERAWSLFGTLEARGFVLRAKFNDRLKHIPTASFDTRFDDPGTRTWDGHDFVEVSTERRLGPTLNLNSRLYWDGVRYQGNYMYGPDSARTVNFDQGDADQVGAEARVDWSPHPRHVITAGAERADVARLVLYNADLTPYTPYVEVRDRFKDSRTATFAQIESRLGASVRVTLGERLDVTHDGGAAWSPRADLVWHLGASTTLKALAGGAFRSPSEFERKYATAGTSTYLLNPNLLPERMRTYELGVDRRWSGLRAQVSIYHDHVRGLIDLVPIDSTTLQYQNVSGARTVGASVELEHADSGGRRVRLSCGVQRSRADGTDLPLENSPACVAQLLGSQPVLAGRGSLALGVRYGAPRRTLTGAWTAGAAVCDGRLSFRPHGALELGLECRNVLDARWSVPASPEHTMNTIEQDGRRLTLTAGIGSRTAP
jgi:iron complex outermembrane receptor protein